MKITKQSNILRIIAMALLSLLMLVSLISCSEDAEYEDSTSDETEDVSVPENREVSYSKTIYCKVDYNSDVTNFFETTKALASHRAEVFYDKDDRIIYAELRVKSGLDIDFKFEYDTLGLVTSSGKFLYEYDSSGNLVKRSYIDDPGQYTTFEYDSNGNKINQSDYVDNLITNSYIYEYDDKGNEIKYIYTQYKDQTPTSENKQVHTYDTDNRKLKTEEYENNEPSGTITYEYLSDGTEKWLFYSADGSLYQYALKKETDTEYKFTTYDSNDTITDIRHTIYDNNENTVYSKKMISFPGEWYRIIEGKNDYDGKGNLIKRTTMSIEGTSDVIESQIEEVVIYEYDKNDNCIKESYTWNGILYAYLLHDYDETDICVSTAAYNSKEECLARSGNYLELGCMTGHVDDYLELCYTIDYTNDNGQKVICRYYCYPDTDTLSSYIETYDNHRISISYEKDGTMKLYLETITIDENKELNIRKDPLSSRVVRISIDLNDGSSGLSLKYDDVHDNDLMYFKEIYLYEKTSNTCIFECKKAVSVSDVEITDTVAKVKIVDADNKEVVIVYTFADQKLTVN